MKDTNKMIGSVVAVVALIIVVAGSTFAWYTWTSPSNTSVSFTVAGIDCVSPSSGAVSPVFTGTTTLIPTSNPTTSNSYTAAITISETCSNLLYVTATLIPTTLPANLIDDGFRWKLSDGTTQLATGTFAGKTEGTSFVLYTGAFGSAVNVTTSDSTTFNLQIWLDGATTETVGNVNPGYTYSLSVNFSITDTPTS